MGTAWIFSDLCQQWNHTGIFTELATSPWTHSLTCESYPYLYLIVLSPGPNYTTLPLSSPEHQPIYQPIYFGIFLNMDFQVPPRVISMHTKNSAPKFLHQIYRCNLCTRFYYCNYIPMDILHDRNAQKKLYFKNSAATSSCTIYYLRQNSFVQQGTMYFFHNISWSEFSKFFTISPVHVYLSPGSEIDSSTINNLSANFAQIKGNNHSFDRLNFSF